MIYSDHKWLPAVVPRRKRISEFLSSTIKCTSSKQKDLFVCLSLCVQHLLCTWENMIKTKRSSQIVVHSRTYACLHCYWDHLADCRCCFCHMLLMLFANICNRWCCCYCCWGFFLAYVNFFLSLPFRLTFQCQTPSRLN